MKLFGIKLKSLLIWIIVLTSLISPQSGFAQPIVANGRIAFSSDGDGDFEIYSVNPDGSDLLQITSNTVSDVAPTWSPDGTHIAFMSDREFTHIFDIYVMDADGSNQINLTNGLYGASPAWSPDGTKIAFVADTDGPQDIFVMNADGSGRLNLTQNATDLDSSPAWSPDGTKIAFTSTRDFGLSSATDSQPFNIYVMNADGTNQIKLVELGRDIANLAWSPDGLHILFETYSMMVGARIFSVTSDGEVIENLTDVEAGTGAGPVWSPDGTKIAFQHQGIATMNVDGTNVEIILRLGEYSRDPSWQVLLVTETPAE